MTNFSELNPLWQHILTDILFLVTVADFALCIYKFLRPGRKQERLLDALVLGLILLFCAYASAAREGNFPAPFPWVLCLLAAGLILAYVLLGVRREYRESLEILSPASIKQTLDNLNSGILFTDARGRAVLVNYTMGEIIAELSGSYPQTYEDYLEALAKAEKLDEAGQLYRLSYGRVWRFQTLPLSDPNLSGFTQTTAQDITELYETNRQLAEENRALGVAIEKMRQMLSLVAERVREKEVLDIKVRVHNEIGNSLIALSALMKGASVDAEEQLHVLQRAVGLFAGGGLRLPETMEEVRREAAELRVKLILDGSIPEDKRLRRLIAAAARECVTNCVRHAKGKTVFVKMGEEEGLLKVSFTNDGLPPKGAIIEGGGLSSLRQRIEEAGGIMLIAHEPQFALRLEFRKGGRSGD